jgi:hypothetical protein
MNVFALILSVYSHLGLLFIKIFSQSAAPPGFYLPTVKRKKLWSDFIAYRSARVSCLQLQMQGHQYPHMPNMK